MNVGEKMKLSKSTITKSFHVIAICYITWFVTIRSQVKLVSSDKNNIHDRSLIARSEVDNLVIYNAVGKRSNLALIEHSRRNKFKQHEWDCVIFMFAYEDRVSDDDINLRKLIDELGCFVPRMPKLMWGDFLQFITPTFADNYDYIALILDDIFMPDQGDRQFDPGRLIENMKANNVTVMTPGIVNDSYNFWEIAKEKGWDECIVDLDMIETYVQFFTRDSWKCFYDMLHHTGKRGWCYDVCFKEKCPDFSFGQDFSMLAWHIDEMHSWLPGDRLEGTELENWSYEPSSNDQGFYSQNGMRICAKLGCNAYGSSAQGRPIWIPDDMRLLSCPSHENEDVIQLNE